MDPEADEDERLEGAEIIWQMAHDIYVIRQYVEHYIKAISRSH